MISGRLNLLLLYAKTNSKMVDLHGIRAEVCAIGLINKPVNIHRQEAKYDHLQHLL
jgi:hypothetical protein